MVSLQKEILNFRQLEEESLGTSWDHINNLITTGLDLAILDPMLTPLIKPLEELSFICLLVKQGLCLIELVERFLP